MLVCAGLPVVLRLAMLAHSPAPLPSAADDTSYLLLGDTLAHFRLSNPTHPFHRFLETNFVLQEPSYSSIFPLGQGIVLAAGQLIFGHPWAGVVLSEALFCGLCYWMLRGWTSPGWALAGGILAAMEFGPLNYWMNSYWGGAASAIAGCLVFGAIPRSQPVLLGLGLALQFLTRPYEGLFLLPALLLMKWDWRSCRMSFLPVAAAVALTLLQNQAVTGSWTTLPYMVSRDQYGVPTTFTFQPNPVPHRELTSEQQADYEVQSQTHDIESRKSILLRLAERFRYLRFFLLPPLYLALPAVLFSIRRREAWWPLAGIGLFTLGGIFYPYFHPHYIAAVACLFVLLSVVALGRVRPRVAVVLYALAVSHFVVWYAIHTSGDEAVRTAAAPYQNYDFINWGDPEGRIAVNRQLAAVPGNHLVFVRYGPRHPLLEWIYNSADIDRSRVILALDLGPDEDAQFRRNFPDRTAWLLEPDAVPQVLVPLDPH